MATRSIRKKLENSHKRSSNPKPSLRSPPPSPSPSVMASWPNYRTIPLLFTVFLIFCVVVVVSLGVSSSVWTKLENGAGSPRVYSIEVVNEFHHDPHAFTQGLVYGGNDTLYESTGLYGRSSVRRVALQTGKVEVIYEMNNLVFGEGLTMIDERLFQVVWLSQTGYVYNRNNFTQVKKFTHQMTDGWGLATDGKVLFGSDGTSTIYKIDPKTMKDIDKHVVKFNGVEIPYLNELEYVQNEVWANIFGKDCIARISPIDGSIVGMILLPELSAKLIADGYRGFDVLNGIAWDSEKQRIFVTGKLWPKIFEIRLRPSKNQFTPQQIEKLCVLPPNHFKFT